MALERGNGHLVAAYLESMGRYQRDVGVEFVAETYMELAACFRAWALREGHLPSLLYACGEVLSGAVLVDDDQDETLVRGTVVGVVTADVAS
jgi:hypothetical protein